MTQFQGYAAMAAGEPLQPYSYEPASLGPLEVEIEISHCGICHSDVHLIDNDWGIGKYPLLPGHEIVGRVVARGGQAKIPEGARVGVGWQRGSCHVCPSCLVGEENICPRNQPTCVGAPGGFADRIRVDHRFVFEIPDGLESENAAPLLCGGITVFSPLLRYAKPTSRVGIIGVGGLGHLALQFASAFGCEVTAFSHSPDKAEEAKRLGAHHFETKPKPSSLDLIVSTVSAEIDCSLYVNALRPNGVLCLVGVPLKPLALVGVDLISGQRVVTGSAIGGRPQIAKMLEFAARHAIVAQTELFPMAEVNEALDRLRSGNVRYRAVLHRE